MDYISIQSPLQTFEKRFREHRCCTDRDLKREILIASIPYVVISVISVLYILGGAVVFTLIDGELAEEGFNRKCLFVFTTLTTIGYGKLHPHNTTSKSFCIAYLCVGIPLILLALTNFGRLFSELFWTITLSLFSNLVTLFFFHFSFFS